MSTPNPDRLKSKRPLSWWKSFAASNRKLWIETIIGTFLLTIVAWSFFTVYNIYYLQGLISLEWQAIGQILFILFLNAVFALLLFKAFRDLYVREAELFMEKEESQAILTSIGDAVFEIDRDRKISVFSKGAQKITGFSAEKVLGRPYQEVLKFMTEDDTALRYEFIEDALNNGVETMLPKKAVILSSSGKKIPVADSAAPVRDAQGNIIGAVVVFRDITKERELENIKLEFLSLASHQLRTPLSGIKWLIETLESGKLGSLTKEQKEYMHFIAQSNDRMIKLVHDLLSVIRLEGDTPALRAGPFLLNDLLTEIYEDAKIPAEKEGLVFTYESPADVEIVSDRTLLKTILDIFVSNAILYSSKKGRIFLVAKPQEEFVQFSVSDDGIGIPRKERSKIFSKFYRASNAKAVRPEGTGLGLYIAKFLSDILGGVIQLESEEGKGTTFHLTVPLRQAAPHPEAAKSLP